ncbi:YraN family protein [Campylobacter canadensis]|uniref:UPF0102 protein AVCANL283_06000 n=1 Tax=Campylobacter canadensis TaxID=449520 RepID=A0ABS7WTF2_9BACT|nr:YraN family protein [Campylobacter canadensis]MBZ7987651.1 YraN family protein [Campylobacter canadensis]MBZ7995026.1 YraN family protein [Campylobacter canadensis]MBZ7996968.1 YraN family protein [Campylobacter canadensis]MBZ7998812.1 YraN family protein [Campylobacter canadensis]MBZ8000447.1 YraN family protein [Campylobacter canadensis]
MNSSKKVKKSFFKQIQGLNSLIFGKNSEDLALKWLEKNRFKIINRNYSCRFGELDIIAIKEDILHFIEVKASINYESEYRLDNKKMQKIIKTIQVFLQKNDDYANYAYCIDLISINNNKINFIENIYI